MSRVFVAFIGGVCILILAAVLGLLLSCERPQGAAQQAMTQESAAADLPNNVTLVNAETPEVDKQE